MGGHHQPATGPTCGLPYMCQWSPSHANWRCDRMSDSTAIFRQEVTDRIRNQVLVNRLTATSNKITKIS